MEERSFPRAGQYAMITDEELLLAAFIVEPITWLHNVACPDRT